MRSGLGELAGDEHENGEGCCGVANAACTWSRYFSHIEGPGRLTVWEGSRAVRHGACQDRCEYRLYRHHRTREFNDELYGAFSLLTDIAYSTISAAMAEEHTGRQPICGPG
jgi:hypothetical protein